MYQALYRKYRPSTFDEVVGQTVIIKTLKNAVNNNKLSHAYLFTGPRGTGKTSIAKILAKTINCENLVNSTPCNNCVICTQINNKQSTDIIEIDAASNNGVDEIRELKSKVNLVPNSSKYKVYIIDEVHMLTTGAFNALLKTLEEPPAHIIFVLATTEPHKIPLTILSRCQRFDFTRISDIDITKRLEYIVEQENIKISKEALLEIARLSDGGMRDSLSLLDQVVAYSDAEGEITPLDVHEVNGTITQENLKQLLLYLINDNLKESFELIDKYDSEGKNLVKLSEEIINYLKNCLFYITTPLYLEASGLNKETYKEISETLNEDKIIEILDIFNLTIQNMKNSSNIKLQLELAFIKILILKQEKTKIKEENKKNISREINIQEIKTIPKKTIKVETKSEEKEIVNPEIKEKLKKIKQIRINNTLARFNKKMFLDTKKSLEDIQTYILNPKYSKAASMTLDGELKAASENNLIFVFKDETSSDFFNENLILIEEMLEEAFNKHYCVISTHNADWEKIKVDFNQNKVNYEYKEEEEEKLEDILKKQTEKKDKIEEIFGDIIQYQ